MSQKPVIHDIGPKPNAFDIENATKDNANYRTVAWSGKYLQVTLMSIEPGQSIGLEAHPDTDQFLRLDAGQGQCKMGPTKDNLNFVQDVEDGWCITVPAGTWHDVVNTGDEPMRLYAVYAPVRDLGLIALWDEGNDSLAEPRAPYPHAREVAALRAAQERCALLIAGHARTAETQALVERGWLAPLELPPAENRRLGPVVRIAADTDWALDRDPAARAARLPHDVFAAIRAGLASGPVLLQVPRAGYVSALACERCREAARCPRCGRTLRGENAPGARGEPPALRLTCGACGPLNSGGWCCSNCGGVRLRAPRVGVRRTAEEIGKAFPQTRVVESWSGHLVESVSDEPALVLATPGAEPTASGGYAAAILLDMWLLLARPEFMRTHRSYIVNMLQAEKLSPAGVVTFSGRSVPVSRLLYNQLQKDYLELLFSGRDA